MKKVYFRTSDLPLASFLYLAGKSIKHLEPEGKRFHFCFSDLSGCQKLADEFWFGDPQVNPRNYHRTLKSLKEMIFNYHGD